MIAETIFLVVIIWLGLKIHEIMFTAIVNNLLSDNFNRIENKFILANFLNKIITCNKKYTNSCLLTSIGTYTK